MDDIHFGYRFYNRFCFFQDSGSYTTECVSGDWFGEVRDVDLADLKQEPDDVCCVFVLYHFITTQRICTDRW